MKALPITVSNTSLIVASLVQLQSSDHNLVPGKGLTKVYVDGTGLIFDVSLNQTNIGNNANKVSGIESHANT